MVGGTMLSCIAKAQMIISTAPAAPSKWPVRLAWSSTLARTFDQAAAEAVGRIAATDPASRRIHDSYQAFRRMLGEPATV